MWEGFRATRSTVDQVLRITTAAHKAKLAGLLWAGVLFDFSKAFDKIDHVRLVKRMREQHVAPYLIRWIIHFLTGRKAVARVNGKLSRRADMEAGVPQGTILGPILFNIYVADLSEMLTKEIGNHTDHGCYADDLIASTIGTAADELQSRLQTADSLDSKWCRDFMEVNVGNTELLVVGSQEVRNRLRPFQLMINGSPIARVKVARVLGVMVDEDLNMNSHVDHVIKEASGRIAQLKCLAGAAWGPKAADMRTFYMGYCCSVLLYACPAWWSLLRKPSIERLEVLHRRAARLISGCAQAADNSSVLLEANLQPLSCIATERTVKYAEQSARLPPGHIRRRLCGSPLLAAARSTISKAIPLSHDRYPYVHHHRKYKSTKFIERISICAIVEGATAKSPKADKKAATLATLMKLPRATHEIWSDGSVVKQAKISGGAAIVFGSKEQLGVTHVPAGILCTSYHAEAAAMKAGLKEIIGFVRKNSIPGLRRLRICSDSQSLIRALESGPIQAEDAECGEIWDLLRSLCELGTTLKVDIQHVLSHCGVARNEAADKEADKAAKTCDQRSAPVCLAAAMEAAKKIIADDWRKCISVNCPRARIVGTKCQPRRNALSRGDERLLAQLRTGQCPLIGQLYHRLTKGCTDCRWCCRGAVIQTKPPPSAPAQPVPSENPPLLALSVMASRKRPREEAEQKPASAPCLRCGKSFKGNRGLAVHLRTCEKEKKGKKRPREDDSNENVGKPTTTKPTTTKPTTTKPPMVANEQNSAKPLQQAKPGEMMCRSCKGFFLGSRGLTAHQRHCNGSLKKRRRSAEAPTTRLAQARLDSNLQIVLPPRVQEPQPLSRPTRVCPSCRKQYRNLTAHMRKCAPKLIPVQPCHDDPLKQRSGGGELESVEHVLFECPALAHIRPVCLQFWPMKNQKDREKAMVNQATAGFIRAALAQVHQTTESPIESSNLLALTQEIATVRPPPIWEDKPSPKVTSRINQNRAQRGDKKGTSANTANSCRRVMGVASNRFKPVITRTRKRTPTDGTTPTTRKMEGRTTAALRGECRKSRPVRKKVMVPRSLRMAH